jgi:hypothetical protein
VITFAVSAPDGLLLRIGRCREDDLEGQVGDGEAIHEISEKPVFEPGRTYRILDGRVVSD